MASRVKTGKRVSVVEERNTKIEVSPPSYQDVIDSQKNGLDEVPKGPKFGCRHLQVILLSLALVTGISTRSNLSVAIVAMTDNSTSPNPDVPTYDWDNTSVILSSFFWSYITLQIVAGYIGETYGPKYFLLVALFLNNCACAATPWAADHIGSYGVILCRVVQGFSQGFLYPSIHVMLGTWAPDDERATLNNIVFVGVNIGSVFATLLTGYISASWLGWTYSFYILSICGFAWCVLWVILGQNSPATHPRITPEEKYYIQNSLKQEGDIDIPIPWIKIFTCVPFYALLIAYVGNIWGYAILMTESPTYLANVMQFDVKSNAVANSIPIPFGLMAALITGPASDWLIRNNFVSTAKCRKISHGIGSYGMSLCLIWLSMLTQKEAKQSYFALALGSMLSAFIMVGCNVNHLDLSPRFSGILFGVLNAAGQMASVVAPLFVQWIVKDLTSVYQWRIVFLVSVGFYVVGATVFIIFGSGTRQEWDGPENKDFIERRKKISVISFNSMP